ncbi:MAG: FGGY family carbohydrate kinase [Actinobacteria bacterium]|nr:FGGY family carbohydrate kinase [Actinomycetota bacterium]
MANKNYIITDLGASNGRIVRGSFDGNTIDMAPVHRFENIPVIAGGSLYWDYLNIYREIKKGILKAAGGSDIISMAIDTWNVDFSLIGRDGRMIFNPLHYRDPGRSDPVLKALHKELSIKEIFTITGWNPLLVAAPFYLYYLRQNFPYIIENTSKFLMMPDLFNYFLTGRHFTEYSIASGSLMLDYMTGTWSERIMDTVGLNEEIMPEILDSGVYASMISKDVCSELGIKPFNVSTCASHDTASAVAGVPAKGKNWAFLGTGTWFILGIETPKKIIKDGVVENGFCNEGGASGSNFFAKNTSAGLWILQECRKKWNNIHNKEFSWEEIEGLARESGPIQAIIDIEDPAFASGSQDMLNLVTGFCRDSGQQVPETIGETAYIILASLAFTVKKYLLELEAFTGIKIEALHMIGGGVYNSLLCQLISNTTGMAILAGPAEAASMGNLIMQLKAGGDIKDLAEGREIISRSIVIKKYFPKDKAYWEEGYSRFKEIKESRRKNT